jgi:dihydrofolate synthase/folylpolyglutamate synthase
VITNIGFDHEQYLGDSIEKIAYEKGGIIKAGVPVVMGEMNYKAQMVLAKLAEERNCVVHKSETVGGNLPKMDLEGAFQSQNRTTAVSTLKVLKESGMAIDHEHILHGLSKVRENTGFMGRYQILGEAPLIIADSAHNANGMHRLISEITSHPIDNLHVVMGVVGDKVPDNLLKELPVNASYYFCMAKIPRALDAEELRKYASTFGLRGECYSSVSRAYEAARLYAEKSDLILISGSTFVVAEIM